MKKELNYLSLPDHFNKYLYVNFNQKLSLKNNLNLRFEVFKLQNLGNAIKAIYLLESIFPRKVFALKIKIKKGKNFEKKSKDEISAFNFDANLNGYEFIDFLRFFSYSPLNTTGVKNLEYLPITNRKLKNFDFKLKLKLVPKNLNQSYNFIKYYHFD
jgi:hypothetical protein